MADWGRLEPSSPTYGAAAFTTSQLISRQGRVTSHTSRPVDSALPGRTARQQYTQAGFLSRSAELDRLLQPARIRPSLLGRPVLPRRRRRRRRRTAQASPPHQLVITADGDQRGAEMAPLSSPLRRRRRRRRRRLTVPLTRPASGPIHGCLSEGVGAGGGLRRPSVRTSGQDGSRFHRRRTPSPAEKPARKLSPPPLPEKTRQEIYCGRRKGGETGLPPRGSVGRAGSWDILRERRDSPGEVGGEARRGGG